VITLENIQKATFEFISHNMSGWLQLILATPVIFFAGGFIYLKAWKSIINRSLNMFTLIAMGVGASYFYSAAMSFSSVSVIGNALRLRRIKL
jgi:cation transport ATPase